MALVSLFYDIAGIFIDGGFVMPPLGFMAALLWIGIGFRFVTLRRGTKIEVRELVNDALKGNISQAKGYIDTAAIIAAKTARDEKGDLRRILNEKLFFITEWMSRYRTLVRVIVIIAPLAGLLGTVSGMIEMFQSLGNQTFYSQNGGVANGISQALLTTQFGLMIAIPGLILGRIMDYKESKMNDEIEQIKEIIATKRDVGEV